MYWGYRGVSFARPVCFVLRGAGPPWVAGGRIQRRRTHEEGVLKRVKCRRDGQLDDVHPLVHKQVPHDHPRLPKDARLLAVLLRTARSPPLPHEHREADAELEALGDKDGDTRVVDVLAGSRLAREPSEHRDGGVLDDEEPNGDGLWREAAARRMRFRLTRRTTRVLERASVFRGCCLAHGLSCGALSFGATGSALVTIRGRAFDIVAKEAWSQGEVQARSVRRCANETQRAFLDR